MNRTLWVIGGDKRYAYAAEYLKRQGMEVKTYAVPGMLGDAWSLEDALGKGEVLLLPLFPVDGEDIRVGTERFPAALLPEVVKPGTVVVSGCLPEELLAWYRQKGVRCESYMERESYQIANAAVTAEGAVAVAMEHLEETVFGAKVLVVGYGRIGKHLCHKLRGLGAEVTVAARRPEHRAHLAAMGFGTDVTGSYYSDLSQYTIVYNTVPHRVFTSEDLAQLRRDCLLIELASGQGGFPPEAPVVSARGLPGKTAPKTAGEILARTVEECISLEGGVME